MKYKQRKIIAFCLAVVMIASVCFPSSRITAKAFGDGYENADVATPLDAEVSSECDVNEGLNKALDESEIPEEVESKVLADSEEERIVPIKAVVEEYINGKKTADFDYKYCFKRHAIGITEAGKAYEEGKG